MLLHKGKIAKMVVVFMAIAMMIVPLNVFAESQVERPTYKNKTVYCSLDCTFTSGADSATATSEWSGKKGYTLKTVLWQRPIFASEFTKLGMSYGTTLAKVSRSKSGVYEFMSKHYGRVGNNDKNNTRIAVLQDS